MALVRRRVRARSGVWLPASMVKETPGSNVPAASRTCSASLAVPTVSPPRLLGLIPTCTPPGIVAAGRLFRPGRLAHMGCPPHRHPSRREHTSSFPTCGYEFAPAASPPRPQCTSDFRRSAVASRVRHPSHTRSDLIGAFTGRFPTASRIAMPGDVGQSRIRSAGMPFRVFDGLNSVQVESRNSGCQATPCIIWSDPRTPV
jgi:hypothetical protein